MSKKIVHDRNNCIGCGACAAVSPETWEMNADGKADLKKGKKAGANVELEVKEFGSNEDAANSCPVNVIHLIDEKGKKII